MGDAVTGPLTRAVRDAADPAAAAVLRRYFQVRPGGYGEGDVFLGVKLSTLRQLARPYRTRPMDLDAWLPMLRSPVHEDRLVTLVVMAERAARSTRTGGAEEPAEIYRAYLAHTGWINNWDLVDVSAKPVVGAFLIDRDRAPLYELARSANLWERRIAIIASQQLLRVGETADLYRLAELLLGDRHDLIHKAVGWSLREAGIRADADELRRFLDRHATSMPRTTLRYAIERFDAEERRRYLTMPS